MLNFEGYSIPTNLEEGLVNYVKHGLMPGGFLYALLCNDLFAAIGSADPWSMQALKELVIWVYNEAPADCWGSEAVVSRYMKKQSEISAKSIAQ